MEGSLYYGRRWDYFGILDIVAEVECFVFELYALSWIQLYNHLLSAFISPWSTKI